MGAKLPGAPAFLADAYDVSVNFREIRLTEIAEMAREEKLSSLLYVPKQVLGHVTIR
jgi:hypothetical protein